MADEKGMLGSAVDSVRKFGQTVEKAKTPIERMNQTFEQLSVTGNTFGNDMIKMQMAATNARMPIEKFAELLQSNNDIMGTLGGSVSKGTQVFSDLAKVYHSSGLTENLRQMGFTTGELNEVLALTVGFQKSTFENTKEGQAKAAASAAQFALELDQLTQLTGVSRKEQEDNLKKAQADMKLEAKFRLIGLEQGEEAEKRARDQFKNNYAQMAAKGMGDLYKEYFATGTAMSKSAQTQMGMYGQAGMNAAKSATELSRGNTELAKVYTERASIEAMKLQKDKAFLQTSIYAGGEAGEASRNLMKANDTAYHGMQNVAKGSGDVEAAMKKQVAAIQEEQKARSGITQSIRTLGIVIDDLNAAASTRTLGELNRKGGDIDKAGRRLSESMLMTKAGDNPEDIARRYNQARIQQEKDAEKGKFSPATRQDRLEGTVGMFTDIGTGLAQGTAKAVTTAYDKGIIPAIQGALQDAKVGIMNVGTLKVTKEETGRAGGTLGETGRAIETKDVMALLHKGEMVLTPEQQKNLIQNVRTEAIGDVLNRVVAAQGSRTSDATKLPGIDLQKIAKDIATTTSKVEIINWPKNFGQVQVATEKKAEDKKAEDKKAEDKKAEDKKSETPKISEAEARKMWEEKQRDLNNQIPTQASVRAVDNAIENKKSNTKVTIDGKDVDPNSPEGQAVIKKLENEEKKLRELFNGKFDTQKAMDMVKDLQGTMPVPKIEESTGMKLKNAETMITETQNVTGGGDNIVRRNAEEAEQEKKREELYQRQMERQAKINDLAKAKEAATERGDQASAAMDTMMAKGQREGKSKEEIEGSEAFKKANQEMKQAYREAENISKDMGKLIVAPLTDAKVEVKSNSEKIKEDMKEALPVQGIRDKTEEMNKLAERRTEIEERLLERQGEVDGLKALANERALTEEEQAQLKLAENGVIRAQNNLKSNLEQQKELDEALGIAKKESDNKILEQTEKANEAQIESVGGMTDAAVAAQSAFMQEINEMFDMPSQVISDAQDSMMKELNEMFDMPSQVISDAQDSMMQETNEMFDMPSQVISDAQDSMMKELNEMFDMPSQVISDAQDSMMQETNEMFDMPSQVISDAQDSMMQELNEMFDMPSQVISDAQDSMMKELNEMFDMPSQVISDAQDSMMQELNEMFDMPSQVISDAQDSMMQELNEMFDMPSQVISDAQDSMMQELNEMFDMPERGEFEEDEYGEGGEDIVLPKEPEEDYIGLALKEFKDQVSGLKEFEEDEYGEGGEAIGGELDRSFEEDEYGAGNDLIGGTDPGDASVAGFDAAEPLAMSNNFVDFGESNPKAAEQEGQADVAPLSMGDFTMGPDGLPIPKPRSQAKTIENQSDAETRRLQRQNDAKKEDKDKEDSKKNDDKKTSTTGTEKQATKTLDDVVKTLESLNSSMNKLINKVEETGRAQVSAVKANNGNLYNRA